MRSVFIFLLGLVLVGSICYLVQHPWLLLAIVIGIITIIGLLFYSLGKSYDSRREKLALLEKKKKEEEERIKQQKKKLYDSQYHPVYLQSFMSISDSELRLYCKALEFFKGQVDTFSPHDMGVAGVEVSSTYYTNLYDKGYFDKPARGKYTINKVKLSMLIQRYTAELNQRKERAQASGQNEQVVCETIQKIESDLINIRITETLSIPESILKKVEK